MMRAMFGSNLVGVVLLGLFTARADAPKKPPLPEPKPVGTAGHSSVRIVEDARWRKVLLAGRDAIKDEDWNIAIFALLVFYENMLLAQTPTEVSAYPQLKARFEDGK